MREMNVYGVSFDLVGKQPIVLLKTADGDKVLPVWIGHPEAASILMKLQGQEAPRPQTHDLLADVIAQLDAEVVRVTVTELRDNTFHASITLRRNGDEIEVDSRTSDAIALALRAGAKIFAADDVIEESGVVFEGDGQDLESRMPATSLADLDPAEFRRFLDTVSPEEFAQAIEEEEGEEGDEGEEDDEEERED
jgi:bifunctional DNase/RNase